jgi:hypothetical protein
LSPFTHARAHGILIRDKVIKSQNRKYSSDWRVRIGTKCEGKQGGEISEY